MRLEAIDVPKHLVQHCRGSCGALRPYKASRSLHAPGQNCSIIAGATN